MKILSWKRPTRNEPASVKVGLIYCIFMLAILPVYSHAASFSCHGLVGTWEQFKPAIGGPYVVVIKEDSLYLEICRSRFNLIANNREEKIYEARHKNKCHPYSLHENVNFVMIKKNDFDHIEVKYCSDHNDDGYCGIESYFNVEE